MQKREEISHVALLVPSPAHQRSDKEAQVQVEPGFRQERAEISEFHPHLHPEVHLNNFKVVRCRDDCAVQQWPNSASPILWRLRGVPFHRKFGKTNVFSEVIRQTGTSLSLCQCLLTEGNLFEICPQNELAIRRRCCPSLKAQAFAARGHFKTAIQNSNA